MSYLALSLCVLTVLCTGCTHYPKVNLPEEAALDVSTPPQYPVNSSGILFETPDDRFLGITTNRAKDEGAATPYVDQFGNRIFLLPVDVFDREVEAKLDAQKKFETK